MVFSRTAHLFAAALLAFAVACGGSKQEPVTYPPGPFTIGGTVSGLIGSGLSLGIAGTQDVVNPDVNGVFSFGGAYAGGTAWSVVVLAQPTSPAETCVVTHGSGIIGADVADVVVTCTGSPQLLSGYFDVLNLTGRVDACGLLRQDSELLASQLALTLDSLAPGSLQAPAGVFSAMPYATVMSGDVTGLSFSVTGTTTFDLSGPGFPIRPADCILAVDVTVSGTITGLGQAHARVTSQAFGFSGSQCDQATADLSAVTGGQVQLPCSAQEDLDLAWAAPFAPRPATSVEYAELSGAHLRDQTSVEPPDGVGYLLGSFQGAPIDAGGSSACFAPGSFVNAYVAFIAAGDIQVQVSADAATWAGQQPFLIGGDNQVRILDAVGGASFSAVSADVTFNTSPVNVGDGLDCQLVISNVVF